MTPGPTVCSPYRGDAIPRTQTPDYGALYLAASTHVRAHLPDPEPDWDGRPRPSRTYPGARRTPLAGRELPSDASLAAALSGRRSTREFARTPLPERVAGPLLHAAAGRDHSGERPYPSAGALYPLELYVAAQDVTDVPDGLHHYDPRAHELELRRAGAIHDEIAQLTLDQPTLGDASVVIALTAVARRTTWKYGQRGWRYVWLEAGHVAQNLCLVAAALGLAAVPVGGFYDAELARLLMLDRDETPLYLVAIGRG